MRRFSLTFALFGSLLATFSPTLSANDSVPVSGTVIAIPVGGWSTILIGGFAGCKFEVDATSSNTKVASVQFKIDKQSKKHKVMVTAESAGMAMVTVTTKNSANPGCQGFKFSFPVQVSPDEKAFLKFGKTKVKAATKDLKADVKAVVKEFCDAVNVATADLKSGKLTPLEAAAAMTEAAAGTIGDLQVDTQEALDEAFACVWESQNASGFTSISRDMLDLVPGGCGSWDKLEQDAITAVNKATQQIMKKQKKFIKQVDKILKAEDELLILLLDLNAQFLGLTIPVPLPAPTPQVVPAPAPKPLTHNSTSSARRSEDSVVRLTIGGAGEPMLGQVTVKIEGPDGFEQTKMVDLNDNCVFRADFPGIKPGSYKVTITQGTREVTSSVSAA